MSASNSASQPALRPATSNACSRYSTPDTTEPALEVLLPCADPAEDMRRVLTVLAAAKLAVRQDVDWQAQLQVKLTGCLASQHHERYGHHLTGQDPPHRP